MSDAIETHVAAEDDKFWGQEVAALGVFVGRVVAVAGQIDAAGDVNVTQLVSVETPAPDAVSLSAADALAALETWQRLGVVAPLASGEIGPADESQQRAQHLADVGGVPMRFAAGPLCGVVAEAAEVDLLTTTVEGTGHRIDHVEHLASATRRGAQRRVPGPLATLTRRRQPARVTVPRQITETHTVEPGQLTALVGVLRSLALATTPAASSTPAPGVSPTNLHHSVAQTCQPAGGGAAAGWSIAAMRAPHDFVQRAEADPFEFNATIAALAISVLALIIMLVVV